MNDNICENTVTLSYQLNTRAEVLLENVEINWMNEMRLFNFFKRKPAEAAIDLTDFKFVSAHHIRYEHGRDVSRFNHGTIRGIRVESAAQTRDELQVSIYKMSRNNPLWESNIQMSPKTMRIIEETETAIKLKGFGADEMGNSFEDYGLTLHVVNSNVRKVTLHRYESKTDIVYKKI